MYDKLLGPGKAILKANIDCAVHTPFLLIPTFYFVTGTIKGQKVNEVAIQLRNEWFNASFYSWLYWTPLMYINFRYMSMQYRIMFIVTLSFIHKTGLSWYSNRERVKQRMIQQNE